MVGSMKPRRGRETISSEAAEESVNCDNNLPVRLFATDRFPVGRLNIYSKVDIISAVHEKLKGTPEFERLKKSGFGKLFEFQVSQCPISSKLIHSLLSRQLITKKKYEWWTVFGGQPLRFSLAEFGFITGLNCSEFPEDDYFEHSKGRNLFWNELIGDDTNATLGDVAALFEKSDDMPSWRKLGLALILIVDGVLIAKHQIGRPTLRYVEMVKDIDSFLDFPWGRESFLATVSAIRPGKKIPGKREDPVEMFRQQLQQQTFRVQGFPLVLQLLAYRSVFGLVERIPNGRDPRTFLDTNFVGFPKLSKLTIRDIRDVENDINLVVVPIIEESVEEDWTEWDDECKDKKVAYMEKLIKSEHVFEKSNWPGGDDSLDMYVHKPKTAEDVHRKHVVARRSSTGKKKVQMNVNGKKTNRRKQRKVDDYFHVEDRESEVDRDGLVAQIAELKDAVKQLSDRVAVLERERGGNERTNTLWDTTKTPDVVMEEVGNDVRSLLEYNGIGPIVQAIRTMYETDISGGGGGALDLKALDTLTGEVKMEDVDDIPNEPAKLAKNALTVLETTKESVNIAKDDEALVGEDDKRGCRANKRLRKEKEVGEEVIAVVCEGMCAEKMEEEKGDDAVDSREDGKNGKEALDDGRVDTLCLSDSSQPPMKRPKYNTSEEERKLATTMLVSKERREPNELLPAVDDAVFKLFRKTLELDKERQHVTPCNFLIDHKFLLDLAKPKHWVTTLHMEVLVSFLGARHEKALAAERSCFVAPWFINHLQGKYGAFLAATNKSKVVWGDEVKQFVCRPGKVWFEDVDTIYVPMIWADEHWVGVVINLKLRLCEVLDPLKSLNEDRKMKRYMAPVVEQLPYIVQQFCKPESHGLEPFVCNRCPDTYENKRGGDSGPIAMKFMELHAKFSDHSGSMADIDDGIVDDLRKQYAMDLYAELIAPQILS